MATNAAATAFSNQRKLDRASNGNLVTVYADTTTNGVVRVSTDGGLTWASGGADIAGFSNGSIFIDADDFLHVVWKQSGTGGARSDAFLYYMRGTPNASRTSWTFAAHVELYGANTSGDTNGNYPDLIVHREGTGWVAHNIWSYVNGTTTLAIYTTMTTTSAGATTRAPHTVLNTSYGTSVHTFPSIDWNHDGGGKVVKAGQNPDLYAGWSAGKTGAGFGIRFRKAVYSAGSWTWNAEREIDPNHTVGSDFRTWLCCLFDGTRAIIGAVASDASANEDLMLYDRDAADTTTTTRLLFDNLNAVADSGLTRIGAGSATYDASGNVYILGSNTAGVLRLRKWTRSTGALGEAVALDAMGVSPSGAVTNVGYVSAKRGYGNNRIEWVYTSGNNSPYAVKYDQLSASLGYYVPQILL